MSEFDLIQRYFNWDNHDPLISVDNGDDGALVCVPHGFELAVAVDTSNSGVHFPADTPAHSIGYKALAVNLSDMAAMGATPKWFTLSLSLPEANEAWLSEFARGLKQLADQFQVSLIGGDTTRGALSISIQILGLAPQGTRLLRSKAQVGDVVCVTGTVGDAAAGLAVVQERLPLPPELAEFCVQRLNYPTPRLACVAFLCEHAHACIDISDGVLSEARHIAQQSKVRVELDAEKLPYSTALQVLPLHHRAALALSGGDDYELLFTVPAEKITQMDQYFNAINLPVTVIGIITTGDPTVTLVGAGDFQTSGYDHFKT